MASEAVYGVPARQPCMVRFIIPDSLEGVVIGAAVGSGLGLVVGVKNAYDGFKADTARCGTS